MVWENQHSLFYPLTLGDEVNFRLIYDGALKSASQSSTRRTEKHAIRLIFDRQLNQLFHGDELLHEPFRAGDPEFAKFKRRSLSFWPIVRSSMHMVCDLDILFLRRGMPGRVIDSGGDLDNRIKVLFDALRVPTEDEMRGLERDGQKGILCLLEDDKLITGFRVTSDQILEKMDDGHRHDVRLIVNVEVKLLKITQANLGYLRQF